VEEHVTFSYKVIEYGGTRKDANEATQIVEVPPPTSMVADFNTLGAEGWRFVSLLPRELGIAALFERAVKAPPPTEKTSTTSKKQE
jgi:hypothetical protein